MGKRVGGWVGVGLILILGCAAFGLGVGHFRWWSLKHAGIASVRSLVSMGGGGVLVVAL